MQEVIRIAPGDALLARRDRRLGYALVAPAVIVLLAVTGYPLVYNIWNSFHTVQLANPSAGHGFSGVSNYSSLFTSNEFTSDLLHTAIFTVVSVSIEMTVGLAIALVLNRSFHGRGVMRAAVLIPWAVPTVVSAMLWKTMFDPQSGFVDFLLAQLHLPGSSTTWLAGTFTSWVAIFVADAWKNVPFVAILLLAGLQAIPGDVYEAAKVDGSGNARTFFRITLPLLKPALLVALVFRTLSAFLIFDVVYIMTGGGPGNATETLSYLDYKSFLVSDDFGLGGAISIVLVVISLLIAAGYTRVLKPST